MASAPSQQSAQPAIADGEEGDERHHAGDLDPPAALHTGDDDDEDERENECRTEDNREQRARIHVARIS